MEGGGSSLHFGSQHGVFKAYTVRTLGRFFQWYLRYGLCCSFIKIGKTISLATKLEVLRCFDADEHAVVI